MANITKRTNKAGEVSFLIRAFVAWGSDGKQITKSMTWKPPAGMKPSAAEKQAHKEAALFEEKIKSGTVTIDGKIKFADYAARWMEAAELRPKTAESYKFLFIRINEAIGHIPLEKLRVEHIQSFIKNLKEDGVSKCQKCVPLDGFRGAFEALGISKSEFAERAGVFAKTVANTLKGWKAEKSSADKMCAVLGCDTEKLFKVSAAKLSDETISKHYKLIHNLLKSAKKSRIIPHVVTEFMDAPKKKKKEARHLDDEQARVFLAAVLAEPDIRIKAAFSILLFTGIRIGELCGLSWSDIDMVGNTVHVRKQSIYVPRQGVQESETKTTGSVRSITTTPFLMGILAEYRTWWNEYRGKLGDSWQGEAERLFIQVDGKPIHPVTINMWLAKFVDRHSFPYITPHSLRHTFVTLQIAAGVDIRTIQARTGHSQAATLLNVYSHAIQSAQDKAALAMDNMLMPIGEVIDVDIPLLTDELHKS